MPTPDPDPVEPVEEQEVTGPSSEPVQPVLTLGSATHVAGLRVGAYSLSTQFIMQGVDAFHLFASLTPAQYGWVSGAITMGLAYLTNFIEARKGRRLLGTSN